MEEKEFDYINMIPFIDVMLVLLTIVLMKTGMIEIDGKGDVYYQGRLVDLISLKSLLSNVSRDTPFLIRADRNIPLQNFVEVLDVVKTMGFRRVSLQTEEALQ